MAEIISIIPARMESSRYPGKPMAEICGVPMIGHVFHRTRLCTSLSQTFVATCNHEIYEYIESIGGKAIMTSPGHERCSDRTAEAVAIIEETMGYQVDFVVMVQGDEPMIDPIMIEQLISPVRGAEPVKVVNLISEISQDSEFESPNTIKVVLDADGNAMYFSREPIPSRTKHDGPVSRWRQLGLILFEKDTLYRYISLEPTELEIVESVDMNRFLENGIKIRTALTKHSTHPVDTKADRDHVEKLMRSDALMVKYCGH